ncbi:Transmembrane protein [Halomonas sp. NYA30]
MNELLHAATQFPSIVFTFLLGLLALYWLLVIIRLAPLDLFERDSLKEDHLASTLVSLGFAGVPATLALTVILTIAAALTVAIELLVLRWLPLGLIRIPVGVVVLWATLVVASPVAAALCNALHRVLHRYRPFTRRCLLGQTVVVTERQGEGEQAFAVIDDEPNSTVKLLSKRDALPVQGERRVLVKYLPKEGAYRSVTEQEYLETRVRLNKLRLSKKHHSASHYSTSH